jgi:hypothetical protein
MYVATPGAACGRTISEGILGAYRLTRQRFFAVPAGETLRRLTPLCDGLMGSGASRASGRDALVANESALTAKPTSLLSPAQQSPAQHDESVAGRFVPAGPGVSRERLGFDKR